MRRLFFILTMILGSLGPSGYAAGSQVEPIQYSYYQLEPDIITNYVGSGKTLGYVRITVNLMVKHASDLSELEHHDPLIRDAIIGIVGRQDKEQVTSKTGREAIRKECLDKVNELMLRETGQKLLVDLLFTGYIYQ